MARAAFEDIIRHQDDPKYNEFRYDGRLNVAECLESRGIKIQKGFYIVEGSTFPEVDYSKLNFFDILFKNCQLPRVRFNGAKFDACEFSPPHNNFDGSHLINMMILDPSPSSASFVGTRITNCTSHGFSNGNFENALIEGDGRSLGQFFNMASADIGFQNCNFDGAVIKEQYIHARLVSSMRNTTISDSVLFNVGIFGEVSHSHFNNVTVEFPDKVPGNELADRRTIFFLSKFNNNTISHCRWDYTAFALPETGTGFSGNSFMDTSLVCSGFYGHSDNYAGNKLKQVFDAQSQGALMRDNNFDVEHYIFYPCIRYSDNILLWRIFLPMALATGLFLAVGVIYAISAKIIKASARTIQHRQQQLFLADFRSLVHDTQDISLRVLFSFQSGMIKYLRDLMYVHHSEYNVTLPKELIENILNAYPKLDLNNPDLPYRAELKIQREQLLWQVNSFLDEQEQPVVVEIQEEEPAEEPAEEPSVLSRAQRWAAQRLPFVRSGPFFSTLHRDNEPANNENEMAVPLLPMPPLAPS